MATGLRRDLSNPLRSQGPVGGDEEPRKGDGAGERDRTVVLSLGSSRSTIELRPRGNIILPSRHRGFQVIQLSVNGQVQRLEPGANIAQLLDALELAEKRVAVERNGEIVPRGRYAATRLAEGDALEIVVAVGGG